MRLVTIIIPVYNEEKYIGEVLKTVYKSRTPNHRKEIIIVNDGSTDNTAKIVRKLIKSRKDVVLIEKTRNEGKGAAVKTGILKSRGDIVIIQDSDLEYSPAEYEKIIRLFVKKQADVVYGSRFLSGQPHRVLYFWHYVANKMLTTFSNMTTNLNLTDMETGCKAFRGDLIRRIGPRLRSKKFGFEPEVTARIAETGKLRIYEIGVAYFGRTYEEGKKINMRDGVRAFFEIIYYSLIK